jgi:hypothetical protein
MDRKSTQPKTQRRRKTAKAPSRKRRGVVVMAPRRPITRSAPVARTTSRSNGLSFYTAKFRGQVGVGVRAVSHWPSYAHPLLQGVSPTSVCPVLPVLTQTACGWPRGVSARTQCLLATSYRVSALVLPSTV